ncbi:MAG: Stage IV sporulation protein A [Brockia lithotrophica]|uniref:Stage IV sporulation protein A n=1 Tax=Brockia lithotrophica TaxID=933949 RepID=A0A2T5G8J0_9BACL|nr:MAG: Stage IV sporulation protein A [Brockia lithotrophica]
MGVEVKGGKAVEQGMKREEVFRDIAERTGGEVYVGVVGPVRTGKSTFIKRFLELLVVPYIEDEEERRRTIDELPQSAQGRTVMTTEPKFIPKQAVRVEVGEGLSVYVRLVDSVGYAIPGARGYEDDTGPRMVHTPWFEEPIPFHEAAEIGTRKVIQDHSTLGIVVTTDGSIGEIPRANYEEAERTVVEELKAVGKPFVVALNSVHPTDPETEGLRARLEEMYDVPVLALSAATMDEETALTVLREALYEFSLYELKVHLPDWVLVLDEGHWLRKKYEEAVEETVREVTRVRDVQRVLGKFEDHEFISGAEISALDLGRGVAEIELDAPDELYEQIVSEVLGAEVRGRDHFLELLIQFARAKREYDHFAEAIEMVRATGYGIATPRSEDLELEKPQVYRQGSRFGVLLRARAPSIHLIRVDVASEFSPLIGSERQSEELAESLMRDFEANPEALWKTEIFGRSLYQVVQDGIRAKLHLMPDEARYKLRETLEKIVNEGSGGLIAILL